MGKRRRKKGKHNITEKIVLATAILNLIHSLVELLKEIF